jgi:hypothetical protein
VNKIEEIRYINRRKKEKIKRKEKKFMMKKSKQKTTWKE